MWSLASGSEKMLAVVPTRMSTARVTNRPLARIRKEMEWGEVR